jgi:hypothetical protein
MKLQGKRVERLNAFGDDLCIELRDNGLMKLSPALLSRIGVKQGDNKIGFAYPEDGEEKIVHVYKAIDGNGVAVNPQGVIKNIPHNRDLRSEYDLGSTGPNKLYVCEDCVEWEIHDGYKFYKITLQPNVEETEGEATASEWDEAAEPEVELSNPNTARAEDTIADLQQAVEKSGGEVIQGQEFTPKNEVSSTEESTTVEDDGYDSTDLF